MSRSNPVERFLNSRSFDLFANGVVLATVLAGYYAAYVQFDLATHSVNQEPFIYGVEYAIAATMLGELAFGWRLQKAFHHND